MKFQGLLFDGLPVRYSVIPSNKAPQKGPWTLSGDMSPISLWTGSLVEDGEKRKQEKRERREREAKGGSPNPNHTSLTHFNLSQFLLRLASHADALRARHAFLPTKECVSPALQARLIYRSFQPSSDPSGQSLFTDYFHNWYLSISRVLSSSLASLRRNQQKINQKSIVKCQVNKAFFNAILTEIIN